MKFPLIVDRITNYHIVKGFNLLMTSLYVEYRANTSSRFPNNSEVFATELLDNIEEMFHQ